MKGSEKGVSMLRDNVHDSTGGWDMSIECFLLSFTDEGSS